MLPASIRHLELCIPCAGPLPTALLRFRQLQQVSLRTGGLSWRSRGGAFLLRRLTHLQLDYRQPPEWNWDGGYFLAAAVQPLEGTLVADLSSATCLSSLELRIGSTRHLLALCKALPALRELRCGGHWCSQDTWTLHMREQVRSPALPAIAVWICMSPSRCMA